MTPSHAPSAASSIDTTFHRSCSRAQSERAGSNKPGARSRDRGAGHQSVVSASSFLLQLMIEASSTPTLRASRFQPGQLVISSPKRNEANAAQQRDLTFHIPWQKPPSKRRREILIPDATEPLSARPIRAETRATLVAAIARGRRWLKDLVDNRKASLSKVIAKREKYSLRQVNMTYTLAFWRPTCEGRYRRSAAAEHCVTRLRDAPVEWSRQHGCLGWPCMPSRVSSRAPSERSGQWADEH